MSYLKHRRGLTGFQIKVIAAISMTIDHIAMYGLEIPFIGAHYDLLRAIGRIAAPLFLFMVVEGARHTHSRPKYVVRLFTMGALTSSVIPVVNLLSKRQIFADGNILFTYAYVVLYIILIEGIVQNIKKKWQRATVFLIAISATGFIHPLYNWWLNQIKNPVILDFYCCCFESPLTVEYSSLMILMGVIMYFAGNKGWDMIVIFLFSAFSRIVPHSILQPLINTYMSDFFNIGQYYMVLALPIIMLYNGQKGRNGKWFFYWYYPLHMYVIIILLQLVDLLKMG